MTTNANQESDEVCESEENFGGLWDADVQTDSNKVSEAEQQCSGSARENTEPVR